MIPAVVVGADSATIQALFAAAVADWRASGVKVVATVSDKHRDGWQAFAPDTIYLTADKAAIQAWRRALSAGLRWRYRAERRTMGYRRHAREYHWHHDETGTAEHLLISWNAT